MAIALTRRRVVTALLEPAGSEGTAQSPTASTDAIPLIREAEFDISPTSVNRPTRRLSLTPYANIYPGFGTVTYTIACELAGRDSGFPAANPNWVILLRACAFRFASNSAVLNAYRVSNVDVDNGPLRNGENLTGTAMSGSNNFSFGDNYARNAGVLSTIFIDDDNSDANTTGTVVGTVSGTQYTVDQRSSARCIGFKPESNTPSSGIGQNTATIEIFADGKKAKAKGCMGNVEFQFNHGDAVVARFEFRGVHVSYGDQSLPTNAFEGHKVPPTFLGSHLHLSDQSAGTMNTPLAAARYGTGGGASQINEGGLNEMTISSGNNIVLQENSIDPNGVNFAFITDRDPSGSFNPTEVESSDFDFIDNFVGGKVMRMRVGVGAVDHTDVTTADQNSFEWILPGITFSGLADADRDGVNIWDASFRIGGGDYDTSALGESVGTDNEMTIIHR